MFVLLVSISVHVCISELQMALRLGGGGGGGGGISGFPIGGKWNESLIIHVLLVPDTCLYSKPEAALLCLEKKELSSGAVAFLCLVSMADGSCICV